MWGLKQFVKSCLEKLRLLSIIQTRLSRSVWSLANVIRSTEAKIEYVVDVGAHRGNFSREMFSKLDLVEGILFEPNPVLFRTSIQDLTASNSKISAKEIAIGATKGESKFHIAANDGLSSSFLNMLELHKQMAPEALYVTEHIVKIEALDEVVPLGWKNILLKIDTQGFELQVLEGAKNTILNVSVIVMEVSFDELYDGAPTATDLINYLYMRNFIIFQIIPVFTTPNGRWLQADLILVKNKLH